MYALVNEGNIKQLTGELLDYLHVSDNDFKPDLTAKICQLVQRFAPDKRWHFDSVLQVPPPSRSPYITCSQCTHVASRTCTSSLFPGIPSHSKARLRHPCLLKQLGRSNCQALAFPGHSGCSSSASCLSGHAVEDLTVQC